MFLPDQIITVTLTSPPLCIGTTASGQALKNVRGRGVVLER